MTIIAELQTGDPAAAKGLLCGNFGFAEGADGRLRLGDQVVALVQGQAGGHGCIDHLALSVPDLDLAAQAALARGAQPDPDVTPDGPRGIAEFWDRGVRYLFLRGPGGARIELIQNIGHPQGPGHDHIGIPCSDIAASVAFVQGLGARLVSSVALTRPDGVTEVRFLRLGTSMFELYQPTTPVVPAKGGHWSRLLIPGAAAATGPDGLTIAPA